MSIRFIKLIVSQETDYLQEHHPNAFLLLCIIARRARRISGHPDGLEIGECHIGDFKKAGISSRQQYRTALDILILREYIKKVETCRTRKKSTTGTTTEGTKVKLLKSDIWDINSEDENHRTNHRPTTDQPPTNHEQERIRKNKKEKEERKNIKKEKSPDISEIPKIQFRDFVTLTQIEYDKLLKKHGQKFFDHMLDMLNSHKGSKGTIYKSDYFTMTQGGWVFKQTTKDLSHETTQKHTSFNAKPNDGNNKFVGQKVLSISVEGNLGGQNE